MKNKKKFPLWLQIVLILTAGIIASSAVFLVARDIKTERYTVTFAYGDGTVIDKKEVKSGCGCFPPVCETDYIFRGWNGKFNEVICDTEVHPMFYEVADDVNLFFFDSKYVREGRRFDIDVEVTGNICFSSGLLTLQYDPDVMKYKESESSDICSVSESEPGKLEIKINSVAPVTEGQLLSKITFFAKRADAYSSELILSGSNFKKSANGVESNADFATINNKIYFLQEVR